MNTHACFLLAALALAPWAAPQDAPRPGGAQRESSTAFEAGEGTAAITPENGLELAGFHRSPGNERRVKGVRQVPFVRALHLRQGAARAAILSLDLCGFDRAFAERVQKGIERSTGVPAENVRVCATHTHAMPTLRFFRQWGAVSPEYARFVEERCLEAARKAKEDLARADLYYGEQNVEGANYNRTSKTWKTTESFTQESTDDERWLDTKLRVLFFLREKPKRNLAWYQFSAHPVCYTDELAGPDWPGLVASKLRARDQIDPSFLQGHCGDANPGTGTPSLGDPEQVSEAVYRALHHAINHSDHVDFETFESVHGRVELPLNIGLLEEQLEQYRSAPEQCTRGEWVDAGFASDWFKSASQYDRGKKDYSAPISALRFGGIALLFHPAELYSFYGLAIERDSPFAKTIVIGYTDDFVGYVPDPAAHRNKEYAAVVVPKILDLPPYAPEAGRKLTSESLRLLERLKAR